jgi:MtN3 and saliva related transmembrane protein
MTTIEIVGSLAAILSTLNQFPQAYKVYRTNDTRSISLSMYCIVEVAIILWLVYGLMLMDGPLIWANALSLIPITFVFIKKVTHTITKKDQKEQKQQGSTPKYEEVTSKC